MKLQLTGQTSIHNAESPRMRETPVRRGLLFRVGDQRLELGYGSCTQCDCGGFTGGWTTCQNCSHAFERHRD